MSQSTIQALQSALNRGDDLHDSGQPRVAAGHYTHAMRLAQNLEAGVPPVLLGRLSRAQARLRDYARQYEAHLAAAVGADRALPRFAHAMDLLLGKRRVYLQEPHMFYWPELPQRQFYEREEFPWTAEFEAATDDIAAEAAAAWAGMGEFSPYLTAGADQVVSGHHAMLNNSDWGAFYLYKDGLLQAENAERCPVTMGVLAALPMPFVGGRLPSVLFSALKPGAHIPPHTGFLNTRLICHLPLVVPGNGALRVGNETRQWEKGRLLIFDDSIEHEAWNRSDEVRIVLLFEIWRPELSEDERQAVARLIGAIDGFSAGAPQNP